MQINGALDQLRKVLELTALELRTADGMVVQELRSVAEEVCHKLDCAILTTESSKAEVSPSAPLLAPNYTSSSVSPVP